MKNPFESSWYQLHNHLDTDCKDFRERYIEMSNAPRIRPDPDLRGCVLLIAGKPGIGGKSVLSHKLLHDLVESDFHSIDLMEDGVRNAAHDEDRYWFRQVISEAKFGSIISSAAAAAIQLNDKEDTWRRLNRRFQRELGSSAIAIRMPTLDAFLTFDVIARDIQHYAESAGILRNCVYLYEYSYVYPSEWEEMKDLLKRSGAHNVKVLEAPLLQVDDAMEFISRQLRAHHLERNAIDWSETRILLGEQAKKSDGLELSIGDLNEIMYRAFAGHADNGISAPVAGTAIMNEYWRIVDRSLSNRKAAREAAREAMRAAVRETERTAPDE